MTDMPRQILVNPLEAPHEHGRKIRERIWAAAEAVGALVIDKLNPKSGYVEVYDPITVTREYRAKRNIFGRIATRQ